MAVPGNLAISEQELSSIDQYRKRKDTAVLTIMFTDLKGFTRLTETKGEEYAGWLRQAHDKILTDTIEEDGAGLVVKYIGDAVMAVFSEPSAAVKTALEIQNRIRAFNRDNPEVEALSVRIGLHMGQVVMENNIQQDIFGRHVNRCSRIESIADGGQIFLSYSVFDSAKGWLAARPDVIFKNHGQYFLKGIDEAIDIYEVRTRDAGPLAAPKNVRKKRPFPKLAASIALFCIGATLTLAVMQWRKTEVWLVKFYPEIPILNGNERLLLEGERSDEQRRIINTIPTGRHVLHYEIASSVRYYSEIDVARGANYLQPKYTRLELPFFDQEFKLNEQTTQTFSKRREFDYFEYDAAGQRQNHHAVIAAEVTATRDSVDSESINYALAWSIDLDGRRISEQKLNLSHHNQTGPERSASEILLYEDEFHYYVYRYFLNRDLLRLTVLAQFIEYKKSE